MSKTPTISVIIPVYGVEDYIAKCLLSVQAQTFNDFECLVVDDGSRDNSIEIGKAAIKDDPRFIFLTKENGGIGSARNLGLEHAKGKYVAFIDSDDYVEATFLEEPLHLIERDNSDICMFSFNCVDEAGNVIKVRHNDVEGYYAKNDVLISKDTVTQYIWTKLYKREVFDSIRFNEEVITYEDVYVNFKILYGRKISNIRSPQYNYLQRSGTLSRDIKPTYLDDRLAITEVQKQFVHENDLHDTYRDYVTFTYLKTFVFFSIVRYSRYSRNFKSDIQALKNVIDPSALSGKNLLLMIREEPKVGFSLLLFKLSPRIFKKFSNFWFRNHVA